MNKWLELKAKFETSAGKAGGDLAAFLVSSGSSYAIDEVRAVLEFEMKVRGCAPGRGLRRF